MRKLLLLLLICTQTNLLNAQLSQNTIDISLRSCVKILCPKSGTSGTGFFISQDLIATCFHVVGEAFLDSTKQLRYSLQTEIYAVTYAGDTIQVQQEIVPLNQSLEPILRDFSVLRLLKPYANKRIALLKEKNIPRVLTPIIFSGYPLATPTMVSHLGTVSGVTKDTSLICIQAPINKGNSGGALIDENGYVIGIINSREGGISLGLSEYKNKINDTKKWGSVGFMGIDPLDMALETINVLDKYISTGIGYAINIKYLYQYLSNFYK